MVERLRRKNIRLIRILFAISLFCLIPRAIIAHTKFENLTIKNGLSTNRVASCFKDAKGIIWFITDNGFCRYDGRGIRIYNMAMSEHAGLSENNFSVGFQRSEDELLFVSDLGNLFSYCYSTGRFVNISEKVETFRNRKITNIYKDKNRNYWFCTSKGLFKTDYNYKLLGEYFIKDTVKDRIIRNVVLTICEDKDGVFWLGTLSRCVIRFDPRTENFSQEELYNCLPKYQQAKSLYTCKNSNFMYVATGGEGLYKINIHDFSCTSWKFKKGNLSSLPSDRITSVCSQGDSILWIGTLDGLAQLNMLSQKITRYYQNPESPYSLVNNIINEVYIDSQDILWVSTFGGVSKLDTRPDRFVKVSQMFNSTNTISSNRVGQCLEDKFGNLWIATSNGIDVLSNTGEKYFHYDLPKLGKHHTNEEVIKFFVDGYTWWIGTWGGGLSRFVIPPNFKPGDSLRFVNFVSDSSDIHSISSNFIRSFAKDKIGNIWFTTWNGGLNKIPFGEKQKDKILFERLTAGKDHTKSLASNFCDALYIDSYQQFWIGTSEGIQKIDFAKNKFEMMLSDAGNPSSNINTSIYFLEGKQNEIWDANFGGLVKIQSYNDFKHSSKIIFNNNLHGVYTAVFDKRGILWFSTVSSEVGSYNPTSGALKFYSMIEETDGFDFYFGKATINRSGRIYIPGNSGYLYFDPANVKENRFIAPVRLTSININNQEFNPDCDISLLKEITLDYDQKNVSIAFASLNYLHPEYNEYKYILEGFDKDWVSLGNKNQITFANIPSGKYNLKIIGSNNDGVWNYNPLILTITIKPPLWENIFFRIFVLIILSAGIYGYFDSKIKRLKKEKERQNRFSKMLIESQEDERKRLSHELHDSLGQNLLVIKNQLDFYVNSDEKNKEELERISDLIKESISEVKDISSNLHPHQLERLGLNKAIVSMINKLSQASGISITPVLDDITGILSKEKEINLYRIIQESLNNIVKHSESKHASIKIKKAENNLSVCIEDNGKGFNASDLTTSEHTNEGLGLKSIAERVRFLNGILKIDSVPGSGTKINFTFEVNK
jgi:signal transduction histidine kinase/ligand-binding sensor domain-containing protein